MSEGIVSEGIVNCSGRRTASRMRAARHEVQCIECRVNWWSWVQRLVGNLSGLQPQARTAIQALHDCTNGPRPVVREWLRKRQAWRNHWCSFCVKDLDGMPRAERWTVACPNRGWRVLCSVECVARWAAVEAGVFIR